MFEKRAEYNFTDPYVLNKPELLDFHKDQGIEVSDEVVQDIIQKLANKSSDGEEAPVFDLQAEIENHPDSLFMKCFAIKADETNDNGDFFSRDELIKATPTFVGVPIFTNHSNADVNQARGKVVHSWWEDDRNGIMIIGRIDAAAYPQLARGIKEEYVVGTSMGCQVQYSICSVCHNYAETPDQYCSCIRERKTREITSRNQMCAYHENGVEKQCPMCGCKKGETKKFAVKTKVFEYNYGIKFIENSFVVNPACMDCGVTEIIDPQKFLAKIAEIQKVLPGLIKAAREIPLTCTDQECIKIAGQQELDSLNQALDLISSVSQEMLNQKEQIDLEFLSDLVKVLADLQAVIDELTEQGYGRLQSPGQPPAPGESPAGVREGPPEVTNRAEPLNPTPGGESKIHSGPAGQVGNVTSPFAKRKLLNLEKVAASIMFCKKNLKLPEFELKKIKDSSQIKTASINVSKHVELLFCIEKKPL
ncbi:MAG: hypothetical protein ACXAC5_03270 [Promethearchaeota archaeon]|jgi:hypothetical protein